MGRRDGLLLWKSRIRDQPNPDSLLKDSFRMSFGGGSRNTSQRGCTRGLLKADCSG